METVELLLFVGPRLLLSSCLQRPCIFRVYFFGLPRLAIDFYKLLMNTYAAGSGINSKCTALDTLQ